MKSRSKVQQLATAPLGSLLVRYTWPALVAMGLNALYSVVDRFYIGHGCGADAMAGLTLAMPVSMLLAAFGVWIGAGHSAVASIRLGAGDRVTCEKCLGELIAWKLILFLVLPPLLFFNLNTVLNLCGGVKVTAGAFAAGKEYLAITLFPHIFSHLAFGLSAMMRSEGAAMRSMSCMIVGFGANLILDPILIFGFNMPVIGLQLPAFGVAGAAWATNISMLLSCLWAITYYLRRSSVIRFRWGRIRIYRDLSWRTLSLGLAPFLQQLMTSIICMALPAAFAYWAADRSAATSQIASLGVFHAVMMLTFMPILGCQQGISPILGYNWGAKNFPRVREAFLLGFKVLTVLCALACAIQVIPPFPTLLARLFVSADNPVLIATAAHDLTVANCMVWCISINVMATTYFMAIGRPKTAVLLSMLRQGVILLPSIWILPLLFADKTFAVWLALPVSDVICQLATLPPLFKHWKFLVRMSVKFKRREFTKLDDVELAST